LQFWAKCPHLLDEKIIHCLYLSQKSPSSWWFCKKLNPSWAWWYHPVITGKDGEFQAILGYRGRPCLKEKNHSE
jgi:hypothetical protein